MAPQCFAHVCFLCNTAWCSHRNAQFLICFPQSVRYDGLGGGCGWYEVCDRVSPAACAAVADHRRPLVVVFADSRPLLVVVFADSRPLFVAVFADSRRLLVVGSGSLLPVCRLCRATTHVCPVRTGVFLARCCWVLFMVPLVATRVRLAAWCPRAPVATSLVVRSRSLSGRRSVVPLERVIVTQPHAVPYRGHDGSGQARPRRELPFPHRYSLWNPWGAEFLIGDVDVQLHHVEDAGVFIFAHVWPAEHCVHRVLRAVLHCHGLAV